MKVNHSKLIENGHLNENGILLVTDAMLLDKMNQLPKSVQEHLEECEKCRNEIFDYYQFRKDDDIQDILPHPYFDKVPTTIRKERKLTKTWAIVASIAVLLGMTFTLYRFLAPLPEKNISTQEKNILPQKKNLERESIHPQETPKWKENKPVLTETKNTTDIEQENKIKIEEENISIIEENLKEYEMLAYFEDKISYNLDNPSRDNYLKVLSPKIAQTYKQNIVFEFDKKNDLDLELEIFTAENKDNPLIFSIPQESLTFKIPQSLENNLYYWQLKRVYQGRKTRIRLGKFMVENK